MLRCSKKRCVPEKKLLFPFMDRRISVLTLSSLAFDSRPQIAKLIMSSQIHARIDSQNKVLHGRTDDQRTVTFTNAIKMGDEYMRETQALLLRINLMRADFIVKGSGDSGPSKSSRQDARGRSGGDVPIAAYAAESGM